MVAHRSALEAVYAVGRVGVADGPPAVTVHERRARGLVQVSGWRDSFAAVGRRLEETLDLVVPREGSRAAVRGDRTLFRIGPERLWLAGPGDESLAARLETALPADAAVVLDLGHSRTVLRLRGPGTPVLLNRGLPVDLDDRVFPADAFAQSVIHHVPVLVHRVALGGDATFDLYLPRDFAVSFWAWLLEAAAPLGGEVGEPG